MNRVIAQHGHSRQGYRHAVAAGKGDTGDARSSLANDALGDGGIEVLGHIELEVGGAALDEAVDVEIESIDADVAAGENRRCRLVDCGLQCCLLHKHRLAWLVLCLIEIQLLVVKVLSWIFADVLPGLAIESKIAC